MSDIQINIPPIGTKGRYVLFSPFAEALEPNELYECAAIRYFTDIENNGRNVYELYYKPFGLPESKVHSDRLQGHVIVTLISPKYPPVYVPSSYIKSYPDLSSKPYNQVVISYSLGPLPDDVILDSAKEAAASVLSDYLGITPIANIGIMPLSGVVTPEQHETREANRQGAINTRSTDYSRLAQEQAKNAVLTQRIQILEQIIIDNGLIS